MSDTPPAGLEDFRALLRLQERDTVIEQLTHRRSHLPAHQAIEDVQKRAGALRPQLQAAVAVRDEIAARQTTLEAEVEAIEQRVATINAKLYGSTIVFPKDAEAMSGEVKHLNQRRSSLEDDELAVMEAREPLEAEVVRLEAEAHGLAEELQAAQAEVAAAQQEIDAELASERANRAQALAAVPASLAVEYEKTRGRLGGVAVAPLVGQSCGGCHLTLSATEIDTLRKAPDAAIIRCEECGRILVR